MADITKTVFYPIPETYLGDTQDDTEVGVTTYRGPRYLRTRWARPVDGVQPDILGGVWGTEDPSGFMPCPPEFVEVILDVEEHPLHALAHYGEAYPPAQITVSCGPESCPDTGIMDPTAFLEVIDPISLRYDTVNERWGTPKFRADTTFECPEGESSCYSWALTRDARNQLLAASDVRVLPDIPDAVKAPWIEYRQQLRDLPTDWADVGNSTYLIQFPSDPDVRARTGRTY
jgi:hypothetical protein